MDICLRTTLVAVLLAVKVSSGRSAAEAVAHESTPADGLSTRYFEAEVDSISASCLSDIRSVAEWQARVPALRRQAAEMLGLDPMPERTPLNPVIPGKLEREDFIVEKLYFQSLPRLYVTANLYLPKHVSTPVPTVLYLCGHNAVMTNGVSFGNKAAYQHHGIWFARNGYACLVLDTLQWGEILGHHRGTYAQGWQFLRDMAACPAAKLKVQFSN